MKRLILLFFIFAAFVFAWDRSQLITLRVVGQPSMTGPLQKNLEQPFFESLQEKTNLPIRVEYRSVDQLGFKDTYQLAMMKNGLFDITSLRFLQNNISEPTLLGIDLPGLNTDFAISRQIANAYSVEIDHNLQERFGVKLLGIWTFGPQVILCSQPITKLADIRGLKVRVGAEVYNDLIRSQGGTPISIPFEQTLEALASKLVDCAITSEMSAYSAGWPKYMTHIYPLAFQGGMNGITIRLQTWNKFNKSQQQILMEAVNAYIDESWRYAKQLNDQGSICLGMEGSCELGEKYQLVRVPVSSGDLKFLREFLLTHSLPKWAEHCNKFDPACSLRWRQLVEPLLTKIN